MLHCSSVENMRESDRRTIEMGTPGLRLMYRAAMGVYLAWPWQGRVGIAVGSGNNGGDGWALACILRERCHDCRVVRLSPPRTPDAAHYAARAQTMGIPVTDWAPGAFEGCGVIVDCLLGTGFQGQAREHYAAAIREINAAGVPVVSVDINSGMNGDGGPVSTAVNSDLTVTIGYVKQGLVTPEAGTRIKRLVCADIGITLAREEQRIYAQAEWKWHEGEANAILCPPWLDMKPINVSDY